jgi:hypothetical protein
MGYEPGHLGVREKNWMAEKGKHVKIQIWNNSNYINYKHFGNMKGTIYGKRLPKGKQLKKGWEPLR